MTSLSPDELRRRRPVWSSLSDLFLDTETRWFLPGLASVIAQSGYDDDAVRRILWVEVAPLCASNLFSIAGEWGGIELDERRLARRAERAPGLASLGWRAAMGWAIGPQLGVALVLRRALLVHDEPQRSRLVCAWRQLAHTYFDEVESGAFGDRLLRDTEVDPKLLRATWESVVRDAFRRALHRSERAREVAWAARVVARIDRAFRASAS